MFMAVFVVLWPYLLTTELRCLQKNNIGHTKRGGQKTKKVVYHCLENYRASCPLFFLHTVGLDTYYILQIKYSMNYLIWLIYSHNAN